MPEGVRRPTLVRQPQEDHHQPLDLDQLTAGEPADALPHMDPADGGHLVDHHPTGGVQPTHVVGRNWYPEQWCGDIGSGQWAHRDRVRGAEPVILLQHGGAGFGRVDTAGHRPDLAAAARIIPMRASPMSCVAAEDQLQPLVTWSGPAGPGKGRRPNRPLENRFGWRCVLVLSRPAGGRLEGEQ